MNDAEIAGYMNWRGPGAYTQHQMRRVRQIIQEVQRRECEAIIQMLRGIDQTDSDSPDGWWETSTGAAFGAGILAAIRARANR